MAPLRLLDVNSMQFADSDYLAEIERKSKKAIRYAVLSPRWLADEDEVQFQDIKSHEIDVMKKGYAKIFQCCRLAKEQGLDFVWLDTCCMDKSNPAEIQESINSMYRWYEEAAVCYAYLRDTLATAPSSMDRDEWFTRGWTLQELIAPRYVEFYDTNWQSLGTKSYLKDRISAITKIDVDILGGAKSLDECSVAARLSWASRRRTKRIEDRAYSLLGLLGVNMPMLYGEGEKSFMRLQEEIIKISDDHSIFAWKGVEDEFPGLLAQSLDKIQNCGSVKRTHFRRGRSAFSMTNRGLSITLNLTQWALDTYLARIHYVDLTASTHLTALMDGSIERGMTGLFLRRLDEDNQYARIRISGRELSHGLRAAKIWTDVNNPCSRDVPVFVRQTKWLSHEHTEESASGFRLGDSFYGDIALTEKLFRVVDGPIGLLWSETERMLSFDPEFYRFDFLAYLDISKQGTKIREIKLCFDFDFNPIIFLADSSAIDAIAAPTPTYSTGSDTYSEQESMSFAARLPHKSHPKAWNQVICECIARKSKVREGLWQLKGDRIEGINVILEGLPIRVTVKKATTKFGRRCWEINLGVA